MTALLIISLVLCSLWLVICLGVTFGERSNVAPSFSASTAFVLTFAIVVLSIALGRV